MYSWPLNNVGLNCTAHWYVDIFNSKYYMVCVWLNLWVQRNLGYEELTINYMQINAHVFQELVVL